MNSPKTNKNLTYPIFFQCTPSKHSHHPPPSKKKIRAVNLDIRWVWLRIMAVGIRQLIDALVSSLRNFVIICIYWFPLIVPSWINLLVHKSCGGGILVWLLATPHQTRNHKTPHRTRKQKILKHHPVGRVKTCDKMLQESYKDSLNCCKLQQWYFHLHK